MIIRVPDIPAEGLSVVGPSALGTVYRDPAWRVDDVRLRLERDGLDVFVTGELRATVSQTCGRCLEPSAGTGATAIEGRLGPRPPPGGSGELAPGDLGVDFFGKGEVDPRAPVAAGN